MSRARQVAIFGIVASIAVGIAIAAAGSDGSVEAGSTPVFLIAAALSFAINWVVFVPSFAARTEKYYDLTGSVTYISITIVALVLSDDLDARAWIAAALVVIWAGRLGSFLFLRIRKDGRDGRFDAIKQDLLRFLMAWTLQGLWVLLTLACALAVITAENRADTDVFLVLGLAVWIAGFAIEVTADNQKSAFRADPANEGKFIDVGLWSWSRHPNYFGEITLWIGMAILALPVLEGWRWVVLISPLFVILLLTRISGVPLLTRRAKKKWGDDPDFQEYFRSTPMLIPRPPRRRTSA
ncbi:MAG: DUF1295 domain-containing protein [Actinomycetota bacterium]